MAELAFILLPPLLAVLTLGLAPSRSTQLIRWVLLAILGMVALGTLSCFPSRDDWAYAASAKSGWLAAQVQWYHSWSGRIAASAVISAWGQMGSPEIGALFTYRLFLLAGWLLFCGVIWDLIRVVLPKENGHDSLLVASTVAVGGLMVMPSINEGIFWLAGAATYLAGTTCGLACASCIIRAHQGMTWCWGPAILLAVLIPLFSEVTAVISLSFLLIYQLRVGKRQWMWILFLTFGLVAGCLINAFSPGNAHRIEEVRASGGSVHDHHPAVLAWQAAQLGAQFIQGSDWSVCFLLAAWLVHMQSPGTAPLNVSFFLIWAVAIGGVVGATALVLAWAGMGPPRAWNPPALIMAGFIMVGAMLVRVRGVNLTVILLVLAALCSLAAHAHDSAELGIQLGAWCLLGASVWWLLRCGWIPSWSRLVPALLIACLVVNPRTTDLIRDGFWRGPGYAQQQHVRIALLAHAAPGSAVQVSTLIGDRPALVHHDEFDLSPKTWQNQAVANYFGLAEVRRVATLEK